MHKAITAILIGLSVITGILFVSILCYSFAGGYFNQTDPLPADTPVVAAASSATPLPETTTAPSKTPQPAATSQPSPIEPNEPNANAPAAGGPENGLTWDGLKLDVANVNYDAWPLIKAQNQYNDPPLNGMTMLMVTLRATNIEGTPGEPIRLWDSDISLIGDRNVVYKSYEVGCGVVPDRFDGVLDVGDSMDGNVCFQVSTDEGGFQLIYEPHNVPATYVNVPDLAEADGLTDVNAPPVLVQAEQLTNNGPQIDILNVDDDAWPLIEAQNQNNDPPLDGMKMILITAGVSTNSEINDGAIKVTASEFELIGDKKQVYKTFKPSCGVIPNRLDGVVSRGNSMDGNICFQIPVDESNLQLIYKASHNVPPTYIYLPEPAE